MKKAGLCGPKELLPHFSVTENHWGALFLTNLLGGAGHYILPGMIKLLSEKPY